MPPRDLVNYFLPETCCVCGKPVFHERYPLCDSCAAILPAIGEPRCIRCGRELISESRICMRCRNRTFAFERHISVFPYTGPVKTVIRAYKFKGEYRLARLFARRLADLWHIHFEPFPIVPVPPRRRRYPGPVRRDHVGRIVRILSREYDIPVKNILIRDQGTPQKTLDFDGRMRNLQGKFHLRGNRPVQIVPGSLVLIDDVFTTGATMSECARVLCEAGARTVYALTVTID